MMTLKKFELWLSRTAFGAWMSKAVASCIDPMISRRSGGRFTSMGPVVIPQLILSTRGRKSGEERDTQLAYTDLRSLVYVVASYFGGERHPAWSYNLQADARAVMQLQDTLISVDAERLSEEDKETVWQRLCDNIPNYSAYKERTARNIKVYRLTPN